MLFKFTHNNSSYSYYPSETTGYVMAETPKEAIENVLEEVGNGNVVVEECKTIVLNITKM